MHNIDIKAYETIIQYDDLGNQEVHHDIDNMRVDSLLIHLRTAGAWDLPPVLIVDSAHDDAGYWSQEILDGHHRIAAASILQKSAENGNNGDYQIVEGGVHAYAVTREDYSALIDANFDGDKPDDLTLMQSCIDCDGVNGYDLANE